MKRFSDLYALLDQTTKTSVEVAALRSDFAEAPPVAAAWVVYFLNGRKPRQAVATGRMRAWAAEEAGIAVRFPRILRYAPTSRPPRPIRSTPSARCCHPS